jgi:four helix bundle protein
MEGMPWWEVCMFSFEKLDVWKYGCEFAEMVYDTAESLPKHEMFALGQQVRRAVVSIIANIAEGSSRSSAKEYSRYVEMAFGSLCEVVAELCIARNRRYLSEERFTELYAKSESLGKMLSRFRATIETSWIKTAGAQSTVPEYQTIRPSNHQTGKRASNDRSLLAAGDEIDLERTEQVRKLVGR